MLTLITVLLGKVQRSHIIVLLGLALVSLVAGAVAFSAVEHVSIGTGLYWSVTTATTVGYGDVTPHNGAGRIIAAAVMLTTIPLFGAAFALFAAAVTATRLSRLLSVESHLPAGRFVVLLGMHPTIPLVAEQLRAAGYLVVVVADVATSTLPSHVQHVPGPPTDEATVAAANPTRAAAAMLVSPDDAELLMTAVVLRHLAPNTPVVAVAQSTKVANALSDLGIGQTISSEALLGNTLAKSLESPHAADVLLSLIDGTNYRIEELEVPAELQGRTLQGARADSGGLVLGVVHDGTVNLGIGDDPTLAAGDRIVRIVAEDAAKR